MNATSEPGGPRVAEAVGTATARRSDHEGWGWRWVPTAAGVASQVAHVLRALNPLGATGVKVTVIEMLAPSVAPVVTEASSLPTASASAPVAPASVKRWGRDTTGWARDTIRRLRSKISEDITQADLARLLETESEKAVRAGQLDRTLKAAYIENQLRSWGIWPLDFSK
jgi:hypothetical protein